MGQPRRAPKSPAQQVAEAAADVERIARAYYEAANEIYAAEHPVDRALPTWEQLVHRERALYRNVTRKLLERGLIQVGHRPTVIGRMPGQITIDEQLDG